MDAASVLIQQLNEEIRMVEINLGSGAAKDYNEYQNLCGKIRGLLIAREAINDLKHTMENSDD